LRWYNLFMKKLYTFNFWELPLAGMFKELLASEGIGCIVRNEQLSAVMGEIPFLDCSPELWVIDEETYPRARLLLKAWLEKSPHSEAWTCRQCGEKIEGQFSVCWGCGALRE
jgi:hypothetical protein